MVQQRKANDLISTLDPDNMPPRSRLFLVVPKNADGSQIEMEMAAFPGMQYCKTDLISTKGIVFVKYISSSTACTAMEAIQAAGSVAGYKVKIMLAEPKTRKADLSSLFLPGVDGKKTLLPNEASMLPSRLQFESFLPNTDAGTNTLLSPLAQSGAFSTGFAQGLTSLAQNMSREDNFPGICDDQTISSGINSPGFALSGGNIAVHGSQDKGQAYAAQIDRSSQDLNSVPPGNRLFIVVHKGVNEETLASVFRSFPGMEYLDLKRDRSTGRSKGYAYVNYHAIESAKAAQAQLNGIEFPQGSGCQLKVLFAAPPGISRSRSMDPSGGSTSSVASENQFQGSPRRNMLATPSQDTATTAFQLSSPNSADSVGQFGYGNVYVQQNSARTDRSTASHDSLLSPLSSPHEKTIVEKDQGEIDINQVQASLGDLNIDLGFFDRGLGAIVASKSSAGIETLRDSIGSSLSSSSVHQITESDPKTVYSVSDEPLDTGAVLKIFEKYGAGTQ